VGGVVVAVDEASVLVMVHVVVVPALTNTLEQLL
jgi:hypothetical protein